MLEQSFPTTLAVSTLVQNFHPYFCIALALHVFFEIPRQTLHGAVQVILVIFINHGLIVLDHVKSQGVTVGQGLPAGSQNVDGVFQKSQVNERQIVLVHEPVHLSLDSRVQLALQFQRLLVYDVSVGVKQVLLERGLAFFFGFAISVGFRHEFAARITVAVHGPSLHADPAELVCTLPAQYAVAAAILFDERVAFGTVLRVDL